MGGVKKRKKDDYHTDKNHGSDRSDDELELDKRDKYKVYKVKNYYRKYPENANKSEYVVFLSHQEDNTAFSDKDRLKISQAIRKHCVSGVLHLRPINRYKVAITFDLSNNANVFIQNEKLLDELSVTASIPAADTEATGVLTSVPTEMSNKQIFSLIGSSRNIIQVRRFMRRVRGEGGEVSFVPTQSVAVTFASTQLPEYVNLDHWRHEEFDGSLDSISLAATCSFNRRGTLLAVGCNDGRIFIWDFLTRGIAKSISAHVYPVCSLSWSRNCKKLLSASTDHNVCIWDILSGECEQRYRFPTPILRVQFDPRNDKRFLVCPMRHAALLVDTDGDHKILPIDEDGDINVIASFDRRGDYVYTGNAKGKILILDSQKLAVKASFKITVGTSSTTSIKSIEFARRGDCFLVNTSDRVIRVYDTKTVVKCGINGEPEPIQKLQDLVNKTTWKKCCFSGDGEYICAGSARQHALYVWEKSIGNIVKILHGTKGELLLDVVWHPVRPIIASISAGVVSIWAQNQVENWSAFAPDFKELDENVEYEERESEFDVEDEDRSVDQAGDSHDDEDVEVDVTSCEPVAAFCSSDEEGSEGGSLHFLPIAPEIEDPEDGWAATQETVTPTETPEKLEPAAKRPKSKTYDITLKIAPPEPSLSFGGKNKQAAGSKKVAGRPRK